ncbi:MAG: imidazole glycerol phosphate synthase subunit HisH [Clostridia bacterium]|nr:imidazole glycerol phosphate synthase subunit HisH [Clostridia bacterium]
MTGIVDYGVGNLFSLKSSFALIGEETTVSGDKEKLAACDRIVLPGVGAFPDAAAKLFSSGLADFIREQASEGKPLIGICLGMQLLFEKGYEYGECDGLGLIPGKVVGIDGVIPNGLKIPHIGWNALKMTKPSGIFENVSDGEYVYFVHSFYAADCAGYVTAVTDYGAPLTAAVQNKNVFGCQFHPEKSSRVGLEILRSFCREGKKC